MTITYAQLNAFFFAFSILCYLFCAWLFYALARFIVRFEEKEKPGSMTKRLRVLIYALFVSYFIFMVDYGRSSGILSLNRFQPAQTGPAAPSVRTMLE